MITIRQISKKGFAVIIDGRERSRFTTAANSKTQNESDAKDFAGRYATKANKPTHEKLLIEAEAHRICHITDAGDNTEPEKFCETSLVSIDDDNGQKIVALASELDKWAATWVLKRAEQTGMFVSDWMDRNTIPNSFKL